MSFQFQKFLLGLKFTVDYEDNYLKLNIGELI